MMENCLDIGTIQAFLDSELTHEKSAQVASHIALCQDCAVALATAEEESAVVFSALDAEYNSLVPTQRLWSKINSSIEGERVEASVWNRVRAFVSTALLSPSFAGAAAILIFVGVMSVVWFSGDTTQGVTPGVATVASSSPMRTADNVPQTVAPSVYSAPEVDVASSTRSQNGGFEVVKASFSPTRSADIRPTTTVRSLDIPGEDSYLKTIDSLSKSVDEQKDSVMRPAERIAYERDLAFVNDTIKKVREQVRRNPRNGSAREILYSSYQNKIDLLNSVSQKEELVASLNR